MFYPNQRWAAAAQGRAFWKSGLALGCELSYEPDQPQYCALEEQSCSVAIALWVVNVRKSAGSQNPNEAGVIRLPLVVVALANHRV